MPRDARAYLWDIQSAAEAIERFVAGVDAETYAQSEVIHSAVERKFEIIGEALGQLLKLDPALAQRIPDIRDIIAFRNLLIHGYAVVEHPRVLLIVQASLPSLRTSAAALLDELGPLGGDRNPRTWTATRMSTGHFARYIGIDYSGAETPSANLKGLRVYMADSETPPVEVLGPSSRRYWSRRGVAEWLLDRLGENTPTLVGIDHGFSFPLGYFDAHGLAYDWDMFLDDFQRHWPTDEDIYVDFVRDGVSGNGAARRGNTRWRRLTERRAGGAKSVFHFDVPGSVAKSTHSGIPWLRRIRRQLGEAVHFWPFDGWDIPAGRSAVAEAYPALWSRDFASDGRTGDQHDAYSIAAWLSQADRDDRLSDVLRPQLSDQDKATASVEGWILGVPALSHRMRAMGK